VADVVRVGPPGGPVVEWELPVLLRSADAADPKAGPTWRADELQWGELASVRVIGASFDDVALAAVVARPADAANANEDRIAVALVGETGPEEISEALVSTEYDEGGHVRRIGIELWPVAAGVGARRLAADRSGDPASSTVDGASREVTPMDFRLDGKRGTGLHELLSPATGS
jgi:hypothetical protein